MRVILQQDIHLFEIAIVVSILTKREGIFSLVKTDDRKYLFFERYLFVRSR